MRIFLAAVLCSTSVLGQVVQISPTTQAVPVGDNITLTCRVDKYAFDLFTEVPSWLRLETDKDIGDSFYDIISSGGGLSEKYLSSNFELTIDFKDDPINKIYLKINDIQVAHDGHYTCNLLKEYNIVEPATPSRIDIVVKQPVKEVKMVIGNAEFWSGNDDHVYEMAVNEQPSVFCQARGSNPKPEITITVGTRDATNLFTFSTTVTYIQTIERDPFSVLRSYTVTASSEDIEVIQDADSVECRASDLSGNDVVVRVQIIHFHTTWIDCKDQSASVGDHRVVLRCLVKTYPKLTNFVWRISNTGEIITIGNPVTEYTARIGEGGNDTTVPAELEISVVAEKHFITTYSLEFQSDEGEHKHDLRLIDKHNSGTTTSILNLLLLCGTVFQFV